MRASLFGFLSALILLFVALVTGRTPQSGIPQEIFFTGIACCASITVMMLSALEV